MISEYFLLWYKNLHVHLECSIDGSKEGLTNLKVNLHLVILVIYEMLCFHIEDLHKEIFAL